METRPKLLPMQHPIERGIYHISTNVIEDLYKHIIMWIKNGSPGAIVYGRPRLGKTRAITFLTYYLKEEFGENLPIFTVYCYKHKANENRFYTDILKDIGHSGYNTGKPAVKKERLINFFIERAETSGYHKIILFIDEAQMLEENDYNWLMDIYNQLDRYSIKMTVILVGQRELFHQKNAFINEAKIQIVGRFMIHEYEFSGVRNKEDLKKCLEEYDIASEFPENSGWSYTRYFFPEAFEQGYRLYEDAEEIFQQFENIKIENKLKPSLEIPMQYITLSIENCLKKYGANGKGVFWPNMNHWRDSIDSSQYIAAEKCISSIKEKKS